MWDANKLAMMIEIKEAETFWYLEGYVDSERQAWRTMMRSFPLRVGRAPTADIRLRSTTVSNEHLELCRREDRIWLRDLGSTNGTYVNFIRVTGEVELHEGDIILLGDRELRLARYRSAEHTATAAMSTTQLSDYFASRERDFHVMMREQALLSHLQPMVSLDDRETLHGFEVLSRGSIAGEQVPPAELFSVAEKLGRERELSELCRSKGMTAATRLSEVPRIFLNTHPAELAEPGELLESLGRLAEAHAETRVVLEIHEAAATGLELIRTLRGGLDNLGYELAFDDFGAGHSRLQEIAEAPPHYLKFDRGLIHKAYESKQRMQLLESLVPTVQSMGMQPVAEGVETPEEAEACAEVGFPLAQGFHFGHPAPIDRTGNVNAAET